MAHPILRPALHPMKVLVVRNDRLGDFMLAWPALALLKSAGISPWVLVPPYTRPMAEISPWIDGIVESPVSESAFALARRLRAERFDAQLTLFSTGRIAVAGALARIPYRLAPATKLFQLLYNRRERQRRSRSEKPEWRYNLDLAERLLRDFHLEIPPLPTPPYLRFPAPALHALRAGLAARYGAAPDAALVMVHPGSGGSANTLSPQQWAALIDAAGLAPALFLINAGPGEERRANEVAAAVRQRQAAVISGLDLPGLAHHIACCDLFIGGSTGPLHVAGALDVPTVGLYPRHRSGNPLRWQTLNSDGRRLALTPPPEAEPREVGAIDPVGAGAAVAAFFRSIETEGVLPGW